MLAGIVVKQSGLILETFTREDYALRLLLCEGEIMVKDDPQFWLII